MNHAESAMAAWRHSRSFAGGNRLREFLVAGAGRSLAVGAWHRLSEQWTSGTWAEQRRRAGVLLLVATAVHVMLLATLGTVTAWMQFIIPAAAALVGAIAVISSRPARARNS